MLTFLDFFAGIGTGAAVIWLVVVMWDHVEWALTISWIEVSVAIGALLSREVAMSGLTDTAFGLKKKLEALSRVRPTNPQTPADLPKEE